MQADIDDQITQFINAFFPLNEETKKRDPDLARIKSNLIYSDNTFMKLELAKAQRDHWLFSFCGDKGFKKDEIESKIREENEFIQKIGSIF